MSVLFVGDVAVVGARERDLETLLASAGIRAAAVPLSDLAALAHPAGKPARVIVVDVRDGKPFPPALALLKKHHPGTAIVLVASALEPALMLEAMHAGVTECVVEPLSKHELHSAILRVSQHLELPPTGQVYAIVGAKGGVGATTTAVNLAIELAAAAPNRTLLIDLHLAGGDAAYLLGLEPRFTLADALENTHRLDEAYFRGLVTPAANGLHVLPSSPFDVAEPFASTRLRSIVDFAARLYDYVVLDVPRDDRQALDTCADATRVIVALDQGLMTVRRATHLIKRLEADTGRARLMAVICRADRHAEIRPDDIERAIGLPIAHAVPSDYRRALRAVNAGKPMALEAGPLTSVYRALARELTGRRDDEKTAATNSGVGLLGRLAQRRA
jgi:pilus assembly protein CpaE